MVCAEKICSKKYPCIFNQTFHNEINRFGWVVKIDNLVG